MRGTTFVSVDGLRIRVCIRGSGPPLLLLNGLGGSLELLEPLRRELADFETIAFDALGTGQSDGPPRPMRLPGYARIAARLLDVLGYRSVHLLGLSWGGALAQVFARRHGDRVRRLVLAATTPGAVAFPGRLSAMRILLTPRRYYSPEYYEAVAPTLYGGRIREDPRLLASQGHLRLVRPPSILGYFGQLFAISGWTSLPFLPFLEAPTLVLAGDDDPITPLANARLLASLIPDAQLSVVEGGGHLFLIVRADESAARIRAFLEADDVSRAEGAG